MEYLLLGVILSPILLLYIAFQANREDDDR